MEFNNWIWNKFKDNHDSWTDLGVEIDAWLSNGWICGGDGGGVGEEGRRLLGKRDGGGGCLVMEREMAALVFVYRMVDPFLM